MITLIIKLEKDSVGVIWGRCKYKGDLYVARERKGKDIRVTLIRLIEKDYPPTVPLRIRLAKYHRHLKNKTI